MLTGLRCALPLVQAIYRAVVNGGGSLPATRAAGMVGSNMAWATAQGSQQTFNTVEWFNGRKLKTLLG